MEHTPTSKSQFIEIHKVSKKFGQQKVLNQVTLRLVMGEEYVIQGVSGSGKSTLLYLLGGLDRNHEGEGKILIDGKNIFEFNDEELAVYRNLYVGFVFQFHFLLPSMNAWDNILLPMKLSQKSAEEKSAVQIFVKQLARDLGVEHLLKKFPYELSGGEQQRMNIIRALSLKPKLLLCDEPTGNLDSENSRVVVDLLRDLTRKFQATLILVTHDLEIASVFKNHLRLKDGMMIGLS